MNKGVISAVVIEMPRRVTEEIYTVPAGFVDNRWLHERILNTNQHKIEYRPARGQKFRGRTTVYPGVFSFDQEVELGIKLDKVETIDHTFHGVIPTKHTSEGTVCAVDYYE